MSETREAGCVDGGRWHVALMVAGQRHGGGGGGGGGRWHVALMVAGQSHGGRRGRGPWHCVVLMVAGQRDRAPRTLLGMPERSWLLRKSRPSQSSSHARLGQFRGQKRRMQRSGAPAAAYGDCASNYAFRSQEKSCSQSDDNWHRHRPR